jgi:hypothetical protein
MTFFLSWVRLRAEVLILRGASLAAWHRFMGVGGYLRRSSHHIDPCRSFPRRTEQRRDAKRSLSEFFPLIGILLPMTVAAPRLVSDP